MEEQIGGETNRKTYRETAKGTNGWIEKQTQRSNIY